MTKRRRITLPVVTGLLGLSAATASAGQSTVSPEEVQQMRAAIQKNIKHYNAQTNPDDIPVYEVHLSVLFSAAEMHNGQGMLSIKDRRILIKAAEALKDGKGKNGKTFKHNMCALVANKAREEIDAIDLAQALLEQQAFDEQKINALYEKVLTQLSETGRTYLVNLTDETFQRVNVMQTDFMGMATDTPEYLKSLVIYGCKDDKSYLYDRLKGKKSPITSDQAIIVEGSQE